MESPFPSLAAFRLVLWSASVIWVGLRVMLWLASQMIPEELFFPSASSPSPFALTPLGAGLVLLLVPALLLLDQHISRERLFFANLGVRRREVAGAALLCATAFESVMAILAS